MDPRFRAWCVPVSLREAWNCGGHGSSRWSGSQCCNFHSARRCSRCRGTSAGIKTHKMTLVPYHVAPRKSGWRARFPKRPEPTNSVPVIHLPSYTLEIALRLGCRLKKEIIESPKAQQKLCVFPPPGLPKKITCFVQRPSQISCTSSFVVNHSGKRFTTSTLRRGISPKPNGSGGKVYPGDFEGTPVELEAS